MRNSLSVAVLARVFANLVGVATSFISIRVYSQYVEKEIYGVITVALGIIGYLPLLSSGFRMVINQRMLAEPDAKKTKEIARFGQLLQTYFLAFVIIGAMVVMVGYSQLPKTRELHVPLAVFLATGFGAACMFQAGNQLGLLVAFGEQVISTFLQSMWGIMGLVILWGCFRLGWGIWAFPASTAGSALLTILFVRIALRLLGKHVPMLNVRPGVDFRERLKTVWRPSLDCLHNQIVTAIIFNADLIIVGVFVDLGSAAVYGIVTRVAALSRQVLQSMSEALWPRLTQETDLARKATMMRKVDRLNAWSVGCWYGAMAATLLPFLAVLAKADWIASPLLTDLILIRSFIISLSGPHSYGLISAGKFKELAWLSQYEAIVGLVLGIPFSIYFGVVGTAVAYLGASFSMSAWQMTREYFRQAHDTHWVREVIAIWSRGLASATLGLMIAWFLWSTAQAHYPMKGWMSAIPGGIAYGIPMAAILLLWRKLGRVP